MPFITLTTDWGTRDHYQGALKGRLYQLVPDVVITDISHLVAKFNSQQAAYVFSGSWKSFPPGTLHIIAVSSQNALKETLALKKEGHIFIGPNDGFFSMIFPETPVDMVVVQQSNENTSGYNLSLLADVSAQLLGGKNLYEIGSRPQDFVIRSAFRPVLEEDVIRGTVIYVDDFGNAVTNITRELFEEQRKGRRFEIITKKVQQVGLEQISNTYNEVEQGSLVAVFNEAGYLEIALNMDSATKLLGLKLTDNIRIEFK
jgi:S-adenosyl-L-methionine hydrolase (adenosine-forming)